MTTREEFQTGDGTTIDTPIADSEAFICDLVELVSSTTGMDPLELPPLVDAIDPEALQAVLQSGAASGTTVRFNYAGCEVVVTGERELFVLERQSSTV